MGDDNQCFVFDKSRERLLDGRFIFRVNACSCFIQYDNRCVFQHSAGDGDTLFFPSGEMTSASAADRIVALRKLPDERVAAGVFCGLLYFCIAGIEPPYADIFADRSVEQVINWRVPALTI